MTRITSSDQVLMLLREQLHQMGKARGRETARSGAASPRQPQSPMQRVQALSARDALNEEEFGKTLVRALLAEQLGEQLALDPGFETIVQDVVAILSQDEVGRHLLADAAAQIRAAG